MALLSLMTAETPFWISSLQMAVLGLGVGMVMQVSLLAIQNAGGLPRPRRCDLVGTVLPVARRVLRGGAVRCHHELAAAGGAAGPRARGSAGRGPRRDVGAAEQPPPRSARSRRRSPMASRRRSSWRSRPCSSGRSRSRCSASCCRGICGRSPSATPWGRPRWPRGPGRPESGLRPVRLPADRCHWSRGPSRRSARPAAGRWGNDFRRVPRRARSGGGRAGEREAEQSDGGRRLLDGFPPMPHGGPVVRSCGRTGSTRRRSDRMTHSARIGADAVAAVAVVTVVAAGVVSGVSVVGASASRAPSPEVSAAGAATALAAAPRAAAQGPSEDPGARGRGSSPSTDAAPRTSASSGRPWPRSAWGSRPAPMPR